MDYFIGLDIGTSAVKAVLIDKYHTVLNSAEASYTFSSPHPGWKEIDPEIWFSSSIIALKHLFDSSQINLWKIRAICCTGQMHTLTVLDKDGKVLRPSLQWNDLRTLTMLENIRQTIRSFSGVPYISKIISTGSPAANLLWLRDNEPDIFSNINKFILGPDYLVYRLCGAFTTDFCGASTSSLYDLSTQMWSDEMRNYIGLRAEQYPQVRGSCQKAGKILPKIADSLGLSHDVNILTGTGDNPAAAVSSGTLDHGCPVLSFGTSCVLTGIRPAVTFDAPGKNILFSKDGKTVQTLVQGVVQSGGGTITWWIRDILGSDDFSDLESICPDLAHSEFQENLIFFPHITGDKTVYRDLTLRGAFIGLSGASRRDDLIRAILLGICYASRELIETMQVPLHPGASVKVTGGGTKSSAWMQMCADVLNIDIERIHTFAGAAYGAALLAAASMGYNTPGSISSGDFFHPRVHEATIYEKQYIKYKKIYDAIRSVTI